MKSKAVDSGNKFARTFNRLSLTSPPDKNKTLSVFLSFSPKLIRQRSVRTQVAVGEEDKGIGH